MDEEQLAWFRWAIENAEITKQWLHQVAEEQTDWDQLLSVPASWDID